MFVPEQKQTCAVTRLITFITTPSAQVFKTRRERSPADRGEQPLTDIPAGRHLAPSPRQPDFAALGRSWTFKTSPGDSDGQAGLRSTELETAAALHLVLVLGDPWVEETAEDALGGLRRRMHFHPSVRGDRLRSYSCP